MHENSGQQPWSNSNISNPGIGDSMDESGGHYPRPSVQSDARIVVSLKQPHCLAWGLKLSIANTQNILLNECAQTQTAVESLSLLMVRKPGRRERREKEGAKEGTNVRMGVFVMQILER